jgi:Gpi18-like mannosyltransferase
VSSAADPVPGSTPPPDATVAPSSSSPPSVAHAAPPAVAARPPERTWPYASGLLGIILVGIGLRAPLAFLVGYGADVSWFARWTQHVTEHGFLSLFRYTDCNYPPFYALVMRGMGELWRNQPWFGWDGHEYRAFQRLPACVADVLIAVLLFAEGRRLLGPRAGLLAALLYFLNPAALYVSAYWGQVDSIHTLFLLAALIAMNRKAPLICGFFAAMSVLQKLQSAAVLPLFVLEAYRYRRWSGMRGLAVGAALAAVPVLAPFVLSDSLPAALERGFRSAIGMYPERSVYAYNLWAMLDQSEASDRDTPEWLLRIAVPEGEIDVPVDANWYVRAFTYRNISLILFSLVVAAVLSLHARTERHDSRSLAAGLLALAFFALPTEMHERYAYPGLALFVLWAIASPQRQAMYWLFSGLFLLNLAGVLGPEHTQRVIGTAVLVLLATLLVYLATTKRFAAAAVTIDHSKLSDPLARPNDTLIRAFQGATLAAWVLSVGAAGLVFAAQHHRPLRASPDECFLSDLVPRVASNGWRRVTNDASVSAGVLQCDGVYALRGLGVHAPSRVQYDIPPGYTHFETRVAIVRRTGHVRALVRLDGKVRWEKRLDFGDAADIRLPLEGARTLLLEVLPEGSQQCDHVDGCGARLVRIPPEVAAPASGATATLPSPHEGPRPPAEANGG